MSRQGRTGPGRNASWLVAFMGLLLASCVSHQPVESKYEAIKTELNPGDRVEVRLHSGEEIGFKVTEIRETEIVGDTSTDITSGRIVTVPLSDIKDLVRVDREHGKELALIGGSIAGAALLIVLAIVVALATF